MKQGIVHIGTSLRLFLPKIGSKMGKHISRLSQKFSCCCSDSQSCLTLCDPMDCSLPGSSVHGISQARVLEWVAISSSRGSSLPRDGSRVSCTGARFFTSEPPGKPVSLYSLHECLMVSYMIFMPLFTLFPPATKFHHSLA